MTIGDNILKVENTKTLPIHNDSNHKPPPSGNKYAKQECFTKGVEGIESAPRDEYIAFYSKTSNNNEILTLIDSGASDHCFVNKAMFLNYTPMREPLQGTMANKNAVFTIIGKEDILFETQVDGEKRKVLLEEVLYTPTLRSDLISVSKLTEKGTKLSFVGDTALATTKKGINAINAIHCSQIYIVKVETMPPTISLTQSNHKSVDFATWHRQLGHVGIETLCKMITNNLVSGLNIQGSTTIRGNCEDCIYGKHTTYPFNKNKAKETEALERIHINMWGPA